MTGPTALVPAAASWSARAHAAARPHMLASRRREVIAELVLESGEVRVEELARRFNVTPQTIRSDIRWLDQQGQLRAVRGGALPPLSGTVPVPEADDVVADLMSQLQQVQRQLEAIVQAMPSITAAASEALGPAGR